MNRIDFIFDDEKECVIFSPCELVETSAGSVKYRFEKGVICHKPTNERRAEILYDEEVDLAGGESGELYIYTDEQEKTGVIWQVVFDGSEKQNGKFLYKFSGTQVV